MNTSEIKRKENTKLITIFTNTANNTSFSLLKKGVFKGKWSWKQNDCYSFLIVVELYANKSILIEQNICQSEKNGILCI